MSATDAELRRVGKAVRELVEALLDLPAAERDIAWKYHSAVVGLAIEAAKAHPELAAEEFSVRVPEPPQLRVVE